MRTRNLLVFSLLGAGAIVLPAFSGQNSDKTVNAFQATPDSEGIYRVGNGVTAPRLLLSVEPEYDAAARKKNMNADCVVEVVVDADGKPRDAHVTKSASEGVEPKLKKAAEGLDRNAVIAVLQYRFAPAEYHGKPVPVRLKTEVSFRIY